MSPFSTDKYAVGICSSPFGHQRIFCSSNPLTSADIITTFAVHSAVRMRQWFYTSALLAAPPPPCTEDHGVWSRWEYRQEGCFEFSSKMLYFDSLPKPHGSRAKDGHEFRQPQLSLCPLCFPQSDHKFGRLGSLKSWDVLEGQGCPEMWAHSFTLQPQKQLETTYDTI